MDRFNRRIRINARTGPVATISGVTRRQVENLEYDVVMEIETGAILEHLAKKAVLGKSGKATALHGLITVKTRKLGA